MPDVAIVTDSSPNIPASLLEEYPIHVVPLKVIWDEKTYADGVDITIEEFYQRLGSSKTMPSTSQPSAADFVRIFRTLHEDGYQILAILISDKLSGTIDSALQARQEIKEAKIEIIDSKSTAMATGFQVLAAAEQARAGRSLSECKEIALKAREKTGVVFVLKTLEFLHRGGRIGGAKRFVGTLLNVKPILTLEEGEVSSLDQVRTHSRALERIVEIIVDRTQHADQLRLATIHADNEETAKKILDNTVEKVPARETYLSEVSPVIGTHTGPGVVGLAYLTDM